MSFTVVQVKIKDNETSEALIRRFKKQLQRSGVLNLAREIRYFQARKNKTKIHKEAARKKDNEKKYKLLRKQGKLKTDR